MRFVLLYFYQFCKKGIPRLAQEKDQKHLQQNWEALIVCETIPEQPTASRH